MKDAPKPAHEPENRRVIFAPGAREAINDKLPPNRICAINQAPAGQRYDGAGAAAAVVVRLPRNTRKAPRRGVQIPLPPMMAVRLSRVSKHAGGHDYPGAFGNGADAKETHV